VEVVQKEASPSHTNCMYSDQASLPLLGFLEMSPCSEKAKENHDQGCELQF